MLSSGDHIEYLQLIKNDLTRQISGYWARRAYSNLKPLESTSLKADKLTTHKLAITINIDELEIVPKETAIDEC